MATTAGKPRALLCLGLSLVLVVAACGPASTSPSPGASPVGPTPGPATPATSPAASPLPTAGASPSPGDGASPAASPMVSPGAGLQPLTAQDISGSLTTMGFGTGDEIATKRVDMFRDLYPDVDLNIPEGGFDHQQFLTAVAGGSPPDAVSMDRNFVGSYAARGALMPLDDCLQRFGVDTGDFFDPALTPLMYNGQLYGLPQFNTVRVVIINNNALQEAGLAVEDVNTGDWDRIRAAAQAMFSAGERLGYDPKVPEFFPLWAKANGADLLSEDGSTANLNAPEVVEALEFTVSLLDDQGGPADFLGFRGSTDFEGENNMVAAGQIGAFPIEFFYVNILARDSPDADVTVVPFLDRQGNPLTYATGGAWVVPNGAANADVACEWAHVMTSAQAWVAAAQARKELRAAEGLPNIGITSGTGNRVADEIILESVMESTGQQKFDDALQVQLEVQQVAFSTPASAAGQEFQDAWTNAVNRALGGEQSAQEALDQAQQEAQQALDEGASQ